MSTTERRAQVIADVMNRLDQQDYRNGFNDSVLSHCRDALDQYDGSGQEFWNQMCCGRQQDAFEEYMDCDKDLADYYKHVESQAEGPGAFVMPDWGTKGT